MKILLKKDVLNDIKSCCLDFFERKWRVHERLRFLPVMFLELYRGGRSNQVIDFEQWVFALSWFVETARHLVKPFHGCGCTFRQIYNMNAVTWCRIEKFLLSEMADADIARYVSDAFVIHLCGIKDLKEDIEELTQPCLPPQEDTAKVSKYEEALYHRLRDLKEDAIAGNPLGGEYRLITKLILSYMVEVYFDLKGLDGENPVFMDASQWDWMLRRCVLLAKHILYHELKSGIPIWESRKLEVYASRLSNAQLGEMIPLSDISGYRFDFDYIGFPKAV